MMNNMNQKPNILFILTDDQRFDTIRALGNQEISTPNLDRLAEMGTSFTHAHIPSGTSGAVCMPSRAMLHSGRSLYHIEGVGQNIPTDHTTMGEAFKNAGYSTIGIGKWHNGPPAFTRSFTDGGSIFFGGMWDHWNVPTCRHDPTGKYDNVINFVVDFYAENKMTQVHCDQFVPGKHSSELLTDTAIEFLNKQNDDNPFLLYLAYLAPHDPRTMPQHFKELYNPEDIELPPNFTETQSVEFPIERFRDEQLAAYPRQKEEIKRNIAEYYAMITHLDSEIGRLLDALEQSGKADNTIIVFSSDNGLAVGQHGLMGKTDNYEHSVRVPLIFAGPGIPKNKKVDQYVYLFDIFPTLCEMTGIDIPESVEGKSFLPVIKNEHAKHRETLYFGFNELIRSVKNRQYKLIEYAVPARATQLFDLLTDPYETNNLYGNPEYDEIVKQMRMMLKEYRDQWDDMKHPAGKKFWDAYTE
jgi:arylsulfatase A-like enzyme